MDLTGKTPWRYYDTGSSDAYTNMAMDEVLLKKMRRPDALPILRVYTWSMPSISVGYFQNVMDDFDLTLCKERGLPLVRRLTGGRAVFHDHELTYSMILPGSYPSLPRVCWIVTDISAGDFFSDSGNSGLNPSWPPSRI